MVNSYGEFLYFFSCLLLHCTCEIMNTILLVYLHGLYERIIYFKPAYAHDGAQIIVSAPAGIYMHRLVIDICPLHHSLKFYEDPPSGCFENAIVRQYPHLSFFCVFFSRGEVSKTCFFLLIFCICYN